jgi:hypothetical protein
LEKQKQKKEQETIDDSKIFGGRNCQGFEKFKMSVGVRLAASHRDMRISARSRPALCGMVVAHLDRQKKGAIFITALPTP